MNGKCNDRVLSQDAGRGGKAEPIICVENLKKSFGDLEVLRELRNVSTKVRWFR